MLRAVLSAILVSLFLSTSSVAQTSRVKDCEQDRDAQLAIKACSELIRAQPRRAQYYVLRGHAHLDADDADAALADAERALKIDGKSSKAYTLRGKAHLAKDDPEQAVEAFSAVIKLTPRDAEAYMDRAEAYHDWHPRYYDNAIADYSQAIKLAPKNTEGYLGRGLVYVDDSQPGKAIADFNKAIQLAPKQARGYDLRAWARYKFAKPAEGLTDVQRALELEPDLASAFETRGHIYQSLNRREEAIADLRKALALDPKRKLSKEMLDWLAATAVPSIKGECTPGSRAIDPSYGALTVNVERGQAKVGEPVTLAWSIAPGQRDVSRPAYLVIALPEAVRLEGNGFYALAPQAPGPFGMRFGAGRVRAIAPLHTKFAQGSGEIRVLPYAAGPLDLDWAVVGVDGCGEWLSGAGRAEAIPIGAGAPQIVLRDEYGDARPTGVIRALHGPFKALVLKDMVQVIDETTGVVVLQRQGTAPMFSSSGRFLTVKSPVAETFDVFDLLAGRAIGSYSSVARLLWSHGDSFLHVEGHRSGWLQIVRTLHGRRHDPRSASAVESYHDDDSKPRKRSDVDIDPGEACCGAFNNGSDAWSFELSLERGIVAFKKAQLIDVKRQKASEPAKDASKDQPDDVSPEDRIEAMIFDLSRAQAELTFMNAQEAVDTIQPDFGGDAPALVKWNVHDALRLDRMERTDDYDVAEMVEKLNAVILPTGTALDPARAARVEVAAASRARRRGMLSIDAAGSLYGAATAVAGAKLDHLPHRLISGYRAGRHAAELRRIEKEIAPLYPPSIARFGVDASNHYGVEEFPDPAPAEPPKEPVKLSLTTAGRDLWRWTAGDRTFWLTQTVHPGRLAHTFDVSMLAAVRGRDVRHSALIAAANGFHAERTGGKAEDEPFDLLQFGDFRGEHGNAFGDFSTVGLSGERYLTLMTRPVSRLIAFDLVEWRVVCAIAEPLDGAGTVSVIMHADARHVTQVNRDGSIHVYSCKSGAEVLSGAYVDDELVVMDRNGYFDGSDDAAAYVELTIPGLPGRHLLSQFVDKLKRPGIAAEVLAGAPPASGPVVSAPPTLRLADLRIDAHSQSELSYLQLYADGRSIRRVEASGRSFSFEIPPAEIAGYRSVSAIAVDRAGLASAPLAVPGRRAANSQPGTLHVLAVGIDKYPRMANADLKFAAADARRIAGAVGGSQLYSKGGAIVLVDAAADENAIRSALDTIVAAAGPADTIVMSFAGHGLIDKDGRLRIALSATSLAELESTSLPFDLVAERLKAAKARVVLLLDVCHAGLSDRASVAANDDAVNRLTTQAGAGMVVLSASKGRQFSLESRSANGGLFSVALERVLGRERKSFDSDGNGAISLDELYRGIKSVVVRETGGRQTPWLTRNQTFGDFDLF